MIVTWPLALFIFFIQLFSYTVKGLVGFGNPLISSPLLSMRLDNVLITPGTLLLDTPINGYIAWKNRRSFSWRAILPILLMNLLGVVPGALLLRSSLPWVLKTLLGLVVTALGLEMATRARRKAPAGEVVFWKQAVVAVLSGACAGLFGINMFLVAYLERTAKDYNAFKGSLCFLFLGENVFRLCVYLAGGLMTTQALLFGAATLPAAALAMVLSNLLAPRLDETKLKHGAIVLFILGGVSIIIKSVVFHT